MPSATTRKPGSSKLVAAARADTPAHLLAFQRTLKNALTRPLTDQDLMQPTWTDGRPMAEFAETFVKGNQRLSAVERLQIYNRMYWFRLIDCFHDDNPGLRALIGADKFTRLAERFLTAHPSSSFTLRNLCAPLAKFIEANPKLTAPHTLLAWDVARFEWAQTVAFDEPASPVLTGSDIAATAPDALALRLQPYVTLLAVRHAVDDYVIAVKRREVLRAESSNATNAARRKTREKNVPLPPKERVYLAVHRLDNRLFYKRLEVPAFKILTALQAGTPLAQAVAAAGRGVKPAQVSEWFATWMQLGWFCRAT